jgi:hypothetical protein
MSPVMHAVLALALALVVALLGTGFLIVPTSGAEWRGVIDPPGILRIGASLLLGGAVAWLLRRQPSLLKTPFLALALAAAPLVPVATGYAPLLLAFQGPMLVLVACAACAVVLVRAVAFRRLEPPALPGWALVLAAFAAYVALGTRVPGAARAQGDEPHYLLMAHSLIHDGDLDLANQYAERQYLPFYGGELEPHVSAATRPGTAYSTHAPGLPVLIAPAYAAGGYRGVVLFLSLLVALGAALLRDVVAESFPEGWTALGTWAVVALTPLLPVYALALYPETVAVVAVALVLWLRRGAPGLARATAAGAVAGGLVWLHPKMLALGAVALLALLPRLRHARARAAAAVAFVLAAAPFLLYMSVTFGSPTLAAGFGSPDLSASRLPWGVLAQLFDRQRGLFAIAPVWALAAFGVAGRWRARPLDGLLLLSVAATPVAVGGAFADWGAGACPPARFPLPALAPLAPFLAEALTRRRDLGAALAGLGFGVLLVALAAPRVLRTPVVGESNLLRDLSPVDLNAIVPTFQGPEVLAPVLLALTAAAALAIAWRYRGRGVLAASLAYLLVADAVRTRPLVDGAAATRQAIETWDQGNQIGLTGPLDVTALSLPLELAGGPQPLGPGDVRRSRRIDLPPGSYRLAFLARPGGEPAEARVSAAAGALVLAESALAAGGAEEVPLFLPVGARGLAIAVAADRGELFFERATFRPEALAPRSLRDRLAWGGRLQPEQYRLDRGAVRVTLLDGVEAEGEAFRIVGAEGRLAVDGPLATRIAVRLRREHPAAPGSLEWGRRTLLLGAQADVRRVLPLADGLPLGRRASVPLSVRAPGALVSFETPADR